MDCVVYSGSHTHHALLLVVHISRFDSNCEKIKPPPPPENICHYTYATIQYIILHAHINFQDYKPPYTESWRWRQKNLELQRTTSTTWRHGCQAETSMEKFAVPLTVRTFRADAWTSPTTTLATTMTSPNPSAGTPTR